jgi:hypothetical protein
MSELTNYFQSRGETSDMIIDERKDDLLKFLCEKGVSFPTEMARQIDIDIISANRILYQFKMKDFVEKINPNKENPQSQFRGRMSEFWSMGIIGFDEFCRHSFWSLTIGGVEFLKTKYPAKKVLIQAGLIHHLNLEVEE